MTITREHLERDHARECLRGSATERLVLSADQLAESLDRSLSEIPAGSDVWLFGYGSLVWSPCVQFIEHRLARISGFHRRLCLWSHINRGTPEKPGLVFGLDRGGSCLGIAFRIRADSARRELELVWRREMLTGAYEPRWLRARSTRGRMDVLAFVIDRRCPGYAGRLSEQAMVEIVSRAHGLYGTNLDYVRRTAESLLAHGVSDSGVLRLHRRLERGG